MKVPPPDIFVSATSDDLRSYREDVSEALRGIGCNPVEQAYFPPDGRRIEQQLREKIRRCDALIHIVGERYGEEPRELDPARPRRSYAQLEYEIARECLDAKRVLVVLCKKGFSYDASKKADPEDEVLKTLQQEHRARLKTKDWYHKEVGTREELVKFVSSLTTLRDQLSAEIERSRTAHHRTLALAGLVLCGVLGGVFGLRARVEAIERDSERERGRRAVFEVQKEEDEQRARYPDLLLAPEQWHQRAMAVVALDEGLVPDLLQERIDSYVADVKSDPGADALDRARVAYQEHRLEDAVVGFTQVAANERNDRLVAERRAARGEVEARAARDRERDAYSELGRTLLAADRPEEAVATFLQVLEVTPRGEAPGDWADIHASLGRAWNAWARVSVGENIVCFRENAIDAVRTALLVYEPVRYPKEWARAQMLLGHVLVDRAEEEQSPESAQWLSEAVESAGRALQIWTRDDFAYEWAQSQSFLAIALMTLAKASSGRQRFERSVQATQAACSALEIWSTPASSPRDWAGVQNTYASVLAIQAELAAGSERSALLVEAIGVSSEILEVVKPDSDPPFWASVQFNLGNHLVALGNDSTGADRALHFSKAADAYRAALTVYEPARSESSWSRSMIHLGTALARLSDNAQEPQRSSLLREAVENLDTVLQTIGREGRLFFWGTAHHNRGNYLLALAKRAPSDERKQMLTAAAEDFRLARIALRDFTASGCATANRGLARSLAQLADGALEPAGADELLAEAERGYRGALEYFTKGRSPSDWREIQRGIAEVDRRRAIWASGAERERLLGEAVAAMTLALDALEADDSRRASTEDWIRKVESERATGTD